MAGTEDLDDDDAAFYAPAYQTEGSGPSPTSRTSVQKVLSVISQFSEYKKFLVEQTGFAGILKLPQITRLNLRFSRWLLQKIDVHKRAIVFGEKSTSVLRFSAADLHKVFGIPCGSRDIHAPESQCSPNTIKFIRSALGMTDKGNQILKVSESVIGRPLDEHTSSNLEKDCFKISFVIFVMGHLLAPSTKHDNRSIDFWSALSNTDNIQDFNWCEYVLQDLFAAVKTVKDDIANNRPTTHLYGCHLWAQIFYLDNLDLGIFNLRHSVMPRVAAFDDTQMRRMILQCSTTVNGVEQWSGATARDASQICYMRAIPDSPPDQITPTMSRSRPPIFPHHAPNLADAHISHTGSALTKPCPTVPSTQLLTASDYATYMKDTYPLLASSELGIILKQHNALGVQQANAVRNNSINESTRFLDKLVQVLSDTCICCSLRSLPCLVQQRHQNSHSNPSASNLFRRRLDQADSDADSSSTRSTKRCRTAETPDTAPQKDQQGIQSERTDSGSSYLTPKDKIIRHKNTRDVKIKNWASSVRDSILMYNDDTSTPPHAVLIGQTADPPTKLCAKHTHYAIDHWAALVDVEYQSIAQQDKLSFIVMSIPQPNCPGSFMSHPHPRFISVPIKTIVDQLVGHTFLEHELCCLIIRRLRQLDTTVLYTTTEGAWRHWFEVDFSTNILSGEKAWDIKSVQDQFIGQGVPYNIALCRLFHVPVILATGWCIYSWDMQKKIIHIFDPVAPTLPDDYSQIHEAIAEKIHVAMFTCFLKFFTHWHVGSTNWTKHFPVVTSCIFNKSESGICILHFGRHFNGSSLEQQLINDSIIREKGLLLHQLMKLHGNLIEVPTGIKAITSSP